MRGLEYLVYSALSVCLLFVMVFLPLAPLFADEATDVVASDTSENAIVSLHEAEDSDIVVTDASDSGGDEANVEVVDQVTPIISAEEVLSDEADVEVSEAVIVHESDEIVFESLETQDVEADEAVSDEILITDSQRVELDAHGESVDLNQEDTELGFVEESAELSQEVDAEVVEELVDVEIIPEEEILDEVETVSEKVLEDEEFASTNDEQVDEVDDSVEAIGETIVLNSVNDDGNKFSFSENECTTVGDGTFYCAKSASTPTPSFTDRIFSASDAEGDKEIYIEKAGEIAQISQNQFDDDAPYYDEVSDTAVWHRLIEGRYQIIVYDFDTEEEKQITSDRYNNMQPNRFGDTLVWQGWVGSDWEIFLSEGDEITMLTDNTTHDITPSINGTHIVWQSFESNAWRMKVYDIRTKTTNTIEDAEGGSIENPRFVLIYDTKFESGDVETRGYDLKSGEVVHLASVPVSLPEELPDPDQTGEERALVTTITQLKPKTEGDTDELPPDIDDGIDSDDVVIPALVIDEIVGTTTIEFTEDASEGVVVDELIIPAFEDTATSSTDQIDDLVVPPFIEEQTI